MMLRSGCQLPCFIAVPCPLVPWVWPIPIGVPPIASARVAPEGRSRRRGANRSVSGTPLPVTRYATNRDPAPVPATPANSRSMASTDSMSPASSASCNAASNRQDGAGSRSSSPVRAGDERADSADTAAHVAHDAAHRTRSASEGRPRASSSRARREAVRRSIAVHAGNHAAGRTGSQGSARWPGARSGHARSTDHSSALLPLPRHWPETRWM